MRHLFFAFVLLSVGCGELSPNPPDSKLNNGNSSNGTPNGSPNGEPVEGDWDTLGTLGPGDVNPKSPGGHAICDLDDVKTDDLDDANVSTVPGEGWSEVASDDPGRCGDDRETLAWRLMNCERIGENRTPLECDLRMVWMGREHTLDMIERDFFAHDNPDGESPFDRMSRHGVGFRSAAENIAVADDVLDSHYSWMDSPGHRGNILGDYTHAGIGSEPADGGLLSTAVFVTP